MPQFRQGNGFVKTMTATGPDKREDGSPLARGEVSHFEFDVEYEGGLTISGMNVSLSDDPATPEWDGSFSERIDIDSYAPGTYILRYRTVDTDGRVSKDSPDYVLEILPPLVAPLPPSNIG